MSGMRENKPQEDTLYRIIAQHLPGGVALYDGPTDTVLWHNAAYANMLDEQWHGMDLTGRSLDELVPAVAFEAREAGRATAAGEMVRLTEVKLLGSSGALAYHNVTLVPVPREDGNGFDVLVALVDVTEEVLAVQEVERLAAEAQQQARELATIIDTVPDGLVVMTATAASCGAMERPRSPCWCGRRSWATRWRRCRRRP